MESKILKSLVVLGVPGVALGVFYLLLSGFGFRFSEISPTWAAVIAIVFLVIVGGVTLYAIKIYSHQPEGSSNQDDSAKRAQARKEDWLQKTLTHTENILEHIQATRSKAIEKGHLANPGEIDKEILIALTPEYAPNKLAVVSSLGSDELKECLSKVEEAFRAVRIAQMDLIHNAEPHSEEYEPSYVVQWYQTQLQNFESVARRLLAGS